MRPLKVTAKFKIKNGNLEAFKAIIPQIIGEVMENDPSTLEYEWYLNEEMMECVVWEVYENSEAVIAHSGNVGTYLDQLIQLADFSLEIYGNPSQELFDAIDGLDVRVYPFTDSI